MVSVGVSRMGKTSVILIEPGAKVSSSNYCERVLGEGLLPDIRAKCHQYRWTLQQDGAPPHCEKYARVVQQQGAHSGTYLCESVVGKVEIIQTL